MACGPDYNEKSSVTDSFYRSKNTTTITMTVPSPRNSQAWETAVSTYKAKLTEKQQKDFRPRATPAECLQVLRELQDRPSKLNKIIARLEPVIQPLKRFEGVVDVLVQTSPMFASPVWGPLRLVITVMSDHLQTLERLVTAVEHITNSLSRITNYEVLFKTDTHVQNNICSLYIKLLDFMVNLVSFYSKPMKRVFSKFDGSFDKLEKDIKFYTTEIDWAANAASINLSERARRSAEASEAVNKRGEILRWLHPSIVEDDLSFLRSTCMVGTCDWILTTPEMTLFTNESHKDNIKIQGPPGCGKSTLAAFVIDHMRSTGNAHVIYIFCNATDPEKNSALAILRTLVAQMVRVEPSLIDALYPVFLQSGRAQVDSFETAKQCYSLALSALKDIPQYFIVDGLDECSDPSGALDALNVGIRDTKAKLLFTSRPVQLDIKSDLVIYPELQDTSPHTATYISHRISRLSDDKRSRLTADDAGQKIHAASGGLWLYCRLMMDEIERAPTAATATRILHKPPRGLVELIESILVSVSARLSTEELLIAQKLLLWVNERDYMPGFLTSTEHGVLPEIIDIVVRHANYDESVANSIRFAVSLCVPLLREQRVRIKMSDGDLEMDELTFFHATMSEYVSSSQSRHWDELSKVLRPQRLSKLYRAETAIWYFSSCSDSQERLEMFKNVLLTTRNVGDLPVGPFLSMSYAIHHALKGWTMTDRERITNDEERAEMERLLEVVISFWYSKGFLRWLEMSMILNYLGEWDVMEDNFAAASEIHREISASRLEGDDPTFNRRCRKVADGIKVIMELTAPWNDDRPWNGVHGLDEHFIGASGLVVQNVLVCALQVRRAMLSDNNDDVLATSKQSLFRQFSDDDLQHQHISNVLRRIILRCPDGFERQYRNAAVADLKRLRMRGQRERDMFI